MKVIDIIAWILLIIGGLNWGLIAIANFDVVAAIFGAASGITMLVYALIGIAAIYAICRWKCCCKSSGSGTSCKM